LHHGHWHIAYQSRSGRPQDPWLEPDINDVLKDMGKRGVKHVVVVPIGFVCDNVEVLYDLDTQARQTAKEAGIAFFRAKTVSDDPEYINALAELVLETV
jgi:ferrochelatase